MTSNKGRHIHYAFSQGTSGYTLTWQNQKPPPFFYMVSAISYWIGHTLSVPQ